MCLPPLAKEPTLGCRETLHHVMLRGIESERIFRDLPGDQDLVIRISFDNELIELWK